MMANKKYILILLLTFQCVLLSAQKMQPAIRETVQTLKRPLHVPQPVKQFLKSSYMQGATFSLSVKDIKSGEVVYAYQPDLLVTPASVMKTVTTAAALEILGEEYTFPTTLAYDGTLNAGVLEGNLYIKGSGDPTLGSQHLENNPTDFLQSWMKALQVAGIKRITGAIIADEGCFDWQGLSWKWVNEDLGSYYGTGSYGITVFDNNYKLILETGESGTKPVIKKIEPKVNLVFHNKLECSSERPNEYYISGMPFSKERYLYGFVPCKQKAFMLRGDIPEPALFLAEYFTDYLIERGIKIEQAPSCKRMLVEAGKWKEDERTEVITTYSPPLKKIVRIVNEVSQNLYADILAKTLGNLYEPKAQETFSSFDKGTKMITHYWENKGLNSSSLWMYDGCGLAVTDKLTANFLTDLLVYMQSKANSADAFYLSLPLAGQEGSVKNFLKGTSLQGVARLKSGSMTGVKSYAGYIKRGNKEYAVSLFINNYSCDGWKINKEIEKLLVALF